MPNPVTSLAKWHRFGDHRPPYEATVIVKPRDCAYPAAGRRYKGFSEDTWEFGEDDHETIHGDDLWCYLPKPPETQP